MSLPYGIVFNFLAGTNQEIEIGRGLPLITDNPQHIIVVGALIRNADDRVLLVRHHRRGWEIPQGKVEEGESLFEALHREVREETGVRVEQGPLAAVWSKLSPPSALIFAFLARYQSGGLTTSDECPEVGWFAADQALAQVTHPVNHDRIKALLNFTGPILYRTYTPHPYQVHEEEILGG
jgi:8-oxo-dGTP diphosphatase